MVDSPKVDIRKPIKVLIVAPSSPNGSQYHRVIVPTIFLDKKEFDVYTTTDLSDVKWADFHQFQVIILSRLITSYMLEGDTSGAVEKACIRYIEESGVKLIVDLDDLPELPKTFRLYETQKKHKTPQSIITALKRADVIWTTNETLKKQVLKHIATKGKHRKPVLVVKNGISKHDKQWKKDKLNHDDLRIGISCMDNHWPDLMLLKPVFEKLKDVKGWRIMAMGVDITYRDEIKKLLGTDRISFMPWQSPYEYADNYKKIDLLVCPLSKNSYNNCRSDIKFAEAAFSNTPVIAENYGPYAGHKCAVYDWKMLIPLVKDYVGGKKDVLDKYLITNSDDYNTELPDQIRINSIKDIVNGIPKTRIAALENPIQRIPKSTNNKKKKATTKPEPSSS